MVILSQFRKSIAILLILMTLSGCGVVRRPIETVPSMESDPTVSTTVQETTIPETTVPETTVPETTVPETTVPETTVPETTVPETTVPPETAPPETEPKPTEPDPKIDADLLVPVADYISGIKENLIYATKNNFTGKVLYDFDEAYLRYGTIVKLKKVNAELNKQGIGIMIWDAFRPLYAQAMLWQALPNSKYVSNPITGTCSHSRGGTVDLTLIDLATGELLEMPSGFDEFSALGDRDYSDCSAEAAKNAQLLETVMVKYGFVPYSGEWWHYSDSDSYELESYYDPAMDVIWKATCKILRCGWIWVAGNC